MKRLGFIGVGMMGKPMAKNLLKAGYELTVLDLNAAAVEELVGEGAVRAEHPVEVMSQCEAVITMLPGLADVWFSAHWGVPPHCSAICQRLAH